MYRSALLGTALLAFFIAVLAGCGGGSSSNTPPPPPTQNTITETIAAVGTPNAIPAVGGYSGEFTVANNAPSGTTVTLISYTVAPGSAPAPQSLARRPASVRPAQIVVSPTVLFWVSHVYSQSVTFDAFPITSWSLPSAPASGINFFLETFDGSTLLAAEQATSVNGVNVNFPGVQKTFDAVAGHTYWWELISTPRVSEARRFRAAPGQSMRSKPR